MIKLFKRLSKPANTTSSPKPRPPDRPSLPSLDSQLYPITWPAIILTQQPLVFASGHALLLAMIQGEAVIDPQGFWRLLQDNEVYQEWINFIVFGRYVQRSFAAFYRQSEDHFNTGMPELLRHELLRYAQYLPREQTLFFAGKLPPQVRQDKLLTLTLNPCTLLTDAIAANKAAKSKTLTINQVRITSDKVTAFAVRHNKRTSERLRCEVMVLDFTDLRLVNEQEIVANTYPSDNKTMLNNKTTLDDLLRQSIILRYYELR